MMTQDDSDRLATFLFGVITGGFILLLMAVVKVAFF